MAESETDGLAFRHGDGGSYQQVGVGGAEDIEAIIVVHCIFRISSRKGERTLVANVLEVVPTENGRPYRIFHVVCDGDASPHPKPEHVARGERAAAVGVEGGTGIGRPPAGRTSASGDASMVATIFSSLLSAGVSGMLSLLHAARASVAVRVISCIVFIIYPFSKFIFFLISVRGTFTDCSLNYL